MGFDIKGAASGLINRGREAVQNGVSQVRDTVQNGANQVREGLNTGAQAVRDTFNNATHTAAEKAAPVVGPVIDILRGRSDDAPFDGHNVYADGHTTPPGTPLERDPSKPLVLYVNGVGNDVGNQQTTLQALESQTGAQVVGIHNATSGHLRDLGQAVLDTVDKGQNKAVDALANAVYDELKAGRPVHLMSHSQGALITGRALYDVQNRLMAEDGMTRAQAEQAMSRINVETFGGASANFPDGPAYVHYVNTADPVPVGFGAGPFDVPGAHLGRDAQVVRFFENHNSLENHSINSTYLNHRVPFDQARSGDFVRHGDPTL